MTKLVAILNTTPDSFYDGGRYNNVEKALIRALELQKLKVDYIDIGGESTKPVTLYGGSSSYLSVDEELNRVLPILETLQANTSLPLSIDTFKPEVAKIALEKGACMLNDITGLEKEKMREIVKVSGCKAVLMHMKGRPKTMQTNPYYPKGVVQEVLTFFEKRLNELADFGIDLKQIILDPGIGFGKTVEDNLKLLTAIPELKKLGQEVYIGASRKSFLGKILKKTPDQLLPATLAIHTITLMSGVDYIRVHDAEEHKDILTLLNKIKEMHGSFTQPGSYY